MNETRIVLFDTLETYENLLPLSYTRPVAEFRVGILTIHEKWSAMMPGSYSFLTNDFLQEKFPPVDPGAGEAVFIAGNIVPDDVFAAQVSALNPGEAITDEDGLAAFRGTMADFRRQQAEPQGKAREGSLGRLKYVFDIFRLNGAAIRDDYARLTSGRKSCAPSDSVTIIGPAVMENGLPSIFIEEGASVEGCTLNVKNGPIYIGRDAEVMEGSCLRGPLSVGPNAKVRMGSKIYGESTFGPYCKVGGEIDNAVMFGYSNKSHDGYLGNAVIGEWCNIGAGTNASNLKNDYSKIRIWNYAQKRFMRTDLQFCGLIMGDHSKAGINCMFNTATVVGVGVNLHGAGFPRQFIPSFSAGSPEGGFSDVSIDKFMEVAGKVMGRRGMVLTDVDRRMFEEIYKSAARFKK